MANNGSDSGVVPAIDTATPAEQEKPFNPLDMLLAAAQQTEEPEPETDYYKPLTDGADGFALFTDPHAAEAAMGYKNGGETDWWYGHLTANQRTAVQSYTGSGYHPMNDWMRMLTDYASETTQARINSLQHALDKFTLPQAIVTHRGMGPEILGLPSSATPNEIFSRVMDIMTYGGKITDLGFTSSSVSSGANFSGKVVIHTQTPAGKGIGAFVAGISSFKNENEFLYNSGTHFEILGAYIQGGQVHINARYGGRDKSTNHAKHIKEKQNG